MTEINSSIQPQNRSVVASLSIPGTNVSLEYDSSRALGNVSGRRMVIGITGDTIPDPLERVEVEILVAGRTFEESYAPEPDLLHTFVWDGYDDSGQRIQGTVRGTIRVGYVYDANYVSDQRRARELVESQSFGQPPGPSSIEANRAREEVTFWRKSFTQFSGRHTKPLGFGGWKPNLLRAPDQLNDSPEGRLRNARTNYLDKQVNDFRDLVDGHTDDGIDFLNVDEAYRDFGPDGSLYGRGRNGSVFWKVEPWFWEQYGGPPGEEREDSAPRSAVTRIAGTDERGYSGDGGPALEARFENIKGLVVDSEGAIYTWSNTNRVLRRIGTDGIVDTVAGTAHTLDPSREEEPYQTVKPPVRNGDLGRATEVDLNPIIDMAVGPDGSIYFAEEAWTYYRSPTYGGTVRRLTPSGRIVPVGGSVENWETDDEGMPVVEGRATDLLFKPTAIDVDSTGTVYVVSAVGSDGPYTRVVRAIRPDGQVSTYLGAFDPYTDWGGNTVLTQATGFPGSSPMVASETLYGSIKDISVGPDDTLYVVDGGAFVGGDIGWNGYSRGSITAVEPDGSLRIVAGGGDDPAARTPRDGEPAISEVEPDHIFATPGGELYYTPPDVARVAGGMGLDDVVPSADGGLAHETDGNGRHVRTRSPLQGTTRWEMEFDSLGRVSAFVDAYDNRTTVERDADGGLAAIEAPTGQRTTFQTDAQGHLSTVSFPDGRTVELDMDGEGLLERIQDPGGNETDFSYDGAGLSQRIDPTGATTDLASEISTADDTYRVTRISPELREAVHEVQRGSDSVTFRSSCCGGRTSSTTVYGLGQDAWEVSRADGSSRSFQQGADPRFGGLAPVTAEATATSPGGQEVTTTTSRSVDWNRSIGPHSIYSFTETVETVAGGEAKTFELSYDGTNGLQVTTPEGRTSELRFDENGFRASVARDGVADTSLTRDSRGRVTEITQKSASTKIEYDDDGNVERVTDASGESVTYGRDDAGRLTTLTRPTGDEESFRYDANGNRTRLTRPNGDVHAFSYTARDRPEVYSPPEGGTETMTYDGDGLPTERVLPSDRTITNSFGPGRGLQAASHPDASVSYTRDDAGRVTELVRTPADGGTEQTVSTVRDGRIVTELSYDGVVSGTFEYDVDEFGRTTQVTDPDGSSRSFAYDADGLQTEAGQFSFTRDGPDGAVSEVTDGTVTITLTYDDRGLVTKRVHSVDGTAFYEVAFDHDAAGLLVERTETVDGTTRTETFDYDPDGRLTTVTRNGSTVEQYAYDANGNRTSKTVDGAAETATYLAGDRLDARGGTSYTHDADGFVTERGSTGLDYSAIGELLEATPGSGGQVTYDYDGHGRRVARSQGSTTTEYLYGNPSDPWQLSVVRETPASGTTVRTAYFYGPDGRLIALDRDGDRYYVGADQVGTPRVVVAADGSVAKVVDRTAFGEVRSDSAPDFGLHVGYAGGLADSTTGTVRFGHRDYDPAAGRFLARDPLRLGSGQYNFYAYAHNNPVTVTDSSGLSCYWDEVTEDATNAIDYASPLKNALSVTQAGVKTASQAGSTVSDVVDDVTVSAATSQGGKAIPSSDGSLAAQAGSSVLNSSISATIGSVAYSVATGATATATAVSASAAATTASAVEASFWTATAASSAISNLPKLADSEYRSAGELLGDTVYEAAHGDLPFEGQPRGPAGGDGGCGEKSPDNC